MKLFRRTKLFLLLGSALWLFSARGFAADNIRIAFSAISPTQGVLWVADVGGFLSKNGLNAEIIYTRAAIETLVAGEVQFGQMTGSLMFSARLQGADPVMIAGVQDVLNDRLVVRPNINSVESLKGKRIAVFRFGSASHMRLLNVLPRYGMSERDVTFLQVGDAPERLIAINSGSVEATLLSPPEHFEAVRLGMTQREQALAERAQSLERVKATLDQQVAQKLQQERVRIAAEEQQRAKLALGNDLDQKTNEISNLQEVLKQRDIKLAEAQKAQAELIRKQRELDDAKRELDLTVEKRVQADLTAERDKARKEAEEELKLKVMEKDQTITAMQKQIEDLRRRAEQGSQQLQGEVQEMELEALLTAKFPRDTIQPVPKGEFGGDVLHRVIGPLNQVCGTILWECKRTKSWSDGWLPKLREDQRAAKAEIAVIISQALPKEVETFGLIDGVWIADPKIALPLALSLRQTLIEVASARQASEGQQTKMEMVYSYLTGPRFRQRVQAIVEAFSSMKEDLDREKKAIIRQWAKREEQIDRVMQATVGMYGDLQGIAGKTLQEIEGLEFQEALESPVEEDEPDPQVGLFKMK